MLSVQQAQTGNRVYGGTTYAPNQGQVSAQGAQGYIRRELRHRKRNGVVRRIGGDGQSDNRSAVAAQALQRKVQFQHGGRPVVMPNGSTPGTKPVMDGASGGIKTPAGAGNPLGAQGAPPGPPPIQITKDGILQLPYDQSFSSEQLSAITDANQKLLDLKAQNDQHALDFASKRRETDVAYDALKRQTLNSNAAGGTAFSSKYGTDVAGNATQYANQVGDLEYENASFQQNHELSQAAIESSLNQQLAALAQDYANNLNDQAGQLGYGTGSPSVGAPTPAPIVKHTGHLGFKQSATMPQFKQHPKRHPHRKPNGGTKPGR